MAKKRMILTGKAPEGPKAVTGLEGPIIGGLATLVAKFGPGVASAINKAYTGNTMLFIQIISSRQENDYYVVELKLGNVSEHGIYLESFSLPDSPDVQLEIGHEVRHYEGMGSFDRLEWCPVENSSFLPVHLPPGPLDGKTVYLRIGPITSKKEKLSDLSSMKLHYEYSPLNDSIVHKKDIRVRLRNKASTKSKASQK
jgi:hypothetical protein